MALPLTQVLSAIQAMGGRRQLREWLLAKAVSAAASLAVGGGAQLAGTLDEFEQTLLQAAPLLGMPPGSKASSEQVRRDLVGNPDVAKRWITARGGRRAAAHPDALLRDAVLAELSAAEGDSNMDSSTREAPHANKVSCGGQKDDETEGEKTTPGQALEAKVDALQSRLDDIETKLAGPGPADAVQSSVDHSFKMESKLEFSDNKLVSVCDRLDLIDALERRVEAIETKYTDAINSNTKRIEQLSSKLGQNVVDPSATSLGSAPPCPSLCALPAVVERPNGASDAKTSSPASVDSAKAKTQVSPQSLPMAASASSANVSSAMTALDLSQRTNLRAGARFRAVNGLPVELLGLGGRVRSSRGGEVEVKNVSIKKGHQLIVFQDGSVDPKRDATGLPVFGRLAADPLRLLHEVLAH